MQIDILIEDEQWCSAITNIEDHTKSAIELSFLRKQESDPCLRRDDASYEISILLTNDAHIRNLNKTYRGKDKPTNVLSFPQDDPCMLGDVIISFDTIKKEAHEQNKSLQDHFTHMLIHGCLHLLGYDHENDEDAQKMETLEIQILKALNIKNPYETV